MIVDIDTSTVSIAGQVFPAVGLLCPVHGDDTDPDYTRVLGLARPFQHTIPEGITITHQSEVFIPAESGALFRVTPETRRNAPPNTLDLSIYTTRCHLYDSGHPEEEPLYLPESLCLDNSSKPPKLLSSPTLLGSCWSGADEDWVAETVARLSEYKLVHRSAQTPSCELLSLPRLQELEDARQLNREKV